MKINVKKTNRLKTKERVKFKNNRNIGKNQISVFKSNLYTYAILINGLGDIVKSISSKGIKGTKTEAATAVGLEIGKIAVTKKMDSIFFNRNGYKYHGRIKAVAEGARKSGVKF